MGVPVYDAKYFRFGRNPAGYVLHGKTAKLGAAFLITIGPLLINTILCALITFAAVIPILILDETPPAPAHLLLMWVGLSIGMHAFPSTQDGRSFLDQTRDGEGNFLILGLAWVLVALLWVANLLRVVWFDAIYAVGIAFLLPWLTGLL